jgi:nitrate reductase gamma subunit
VRVAIGRADFIDITRSSPLSTGDLSTLSLLEFARGPGLVFAFGVFVLGSLWRLIALLRLPRRPDLSPPRAGAPGRWAGASQAILQAMWPRPAFGPRAWQASANGYAFHIGLALVCFAYAPHIAFIHRTTGLSWPALPDAVMYLAAAVTIVSLLLALWARLARPVLKLISRPDDYITWVVTFLPIITGMAVIGEPSVPVLARQHVVYPMPLALHLLSLELLLVWFPFGKLMHAFLFVFSRGATGVRFSHRGVGP